MRKIAYIATPIEFGGAEKVGINLLKCINRDLFEIIPIVLFRPWEKKTLFEIEIEKANYRYLKIPVAAKPVDKGKDYFRIIRSYKILYNIIKENRFNLVHTNGYFGDIMAIPICKLFKIPHLAICHGFLKNSLNLKIYNKLDLFFLKFSNKIYAVSEELKKQIVNSGINEDIVEVLQNAVELIDPILKDKRRKEGRQLLNIEHGEIVIGYVGRLSNEKGIQYLIEAGATLKKNGEKFKMVIIGDGIKRKDLENLVKAKDLEKEIIFTGFQNNIEEWLPALDIFVLPSLTEGTPLALLEAMAAGIPVIASAVGGVPKVIENGVDGILLPSGDSQELSKAIIKIKRDDVLRKKIAVAGVNKIKNEYDIKKWCQKIESQYNLMLGYKNSK
jgi:glycosyltransferase involved in cell wall biosynthesis